MCDPTCSLSASLTYLATPRSRSAFVEQRRGIIAPGYDGDLTIIEGPGLGELARGAGAPGALLTARIRATVVAGRIRHE
jgi:predicted amidohydrolase YtcJ